VKLVLLLVLLVLLAAVRQAAQGEVTVDWSAGEVRAVAAHGP